MNGSSPAATRPHIVNLNLLPLQERPVEAPKWAVVAGALFVAAVIAMVPLGMQERHARAQADAVADQAADAEAGLHGLQVDIAKQRGMRQDLSAAEAEIGALVEQRARLQGGTRPLSDDLAWLWGPGLLPSAARISSIAGTDGGLRIEGSAASPLDAISYAQRLAKVAGFASARMATFAPGARGGGVFTVEVTR